MSGTGQRSPGTRQALAACAVLLLAPWAAIKHAQAETAAEAAKRPVVGPTPARLPDGHPNWTGFWVPQNGMLEHDIGLGGSPAGGGPGSKPSEIIPPPPGSGDKPSEGSPPPPGGPGGKPGGPPPGPAMPFAHFSAMKEPYKTQLQGVMQAVMTGKLADPVATCFPPGMPRMMVMVYGMELLQTPGQIAITSEWQAASRRIWMKQKTHTSADELDPTYTGESIGHWEGDTLIVDTTGIRVKDVPLNYTGLMHSDALHVVERFKETKPGVLVDEITIDDPKVFVAPWKEIETYRYRPDLRLEEYVCLENNRNVGPNGEATFK